MLDGFVTVTAPVWVPLLLIVSAVVAAGLIEWIDRKKGRLP